MIVIFSPYPYETLRQDGMFRRIYNIDMLFANEERLYVYNEYQGSDYSIREPFYIADKTYVQLLDFRFAAHHIKLAEILNNASVIYAQTMIFSSTYLYPYYSSNKIITDAHGIAAEEERIVGRNQRGNYIEHFEANAVKNSRAVMVVTNAMKEFYKKTFNHQKDNFIYLPINVTEMVNIEKKHNERKKVVYAGGLHKWQNVEDMLQTVGELKDKYEFIFLTNEPDELRKISDRMGVSQYIKIDSVPHEQIKNYFESADFGFVLRDDIAVNNVAFPTKLVEYLAYKIIPIVKNPNIGDFAADKGKYILLEDFIAGKIPTDAEISDMQEYNYKLYLQIFEHYEQGKTKLLELIDKIKSENNRFSIIEKMPSTVQTSFLPLDIECMYNTDEKQEKRFIDIADFPYKYSINMENKHIKDIVFTVINKTFIAELPKIEVTSGQEKIEILPSNQDSLVMHNNDVYLEPMSYLKYNIDRTCSDITIYFNIKLYGPECNVVNNKIIKEEHISNQSEVLQSSLIEKFKYNCKKYGIKYTLKKTFSYIRGKL